MTTARPRSPKSPAAQAERPRGRAPGGRDLRRADRLLAFGTGGSRREFWFAIIRHTAHVNLQLGDGAELPNPDGRIEGTGKRIRHVKVRSVEDAASSWLRTIIESG